MVQRHEDILEHPLKPVCDQWLQKLRQAEDVKWERFGQYADEAMKFFDGEQNWTWREDYAYGEGGFLDKDAVGAGGLPKFRVQVNKLFDAVSLIGPALMHRYPSVEVTPVEYPPIGPHLLGVDIEDPRAQQEWQIHQQQLQMQEAVKANMAALKEHYLDWVQRVGNKRKEAQRCITECIIKGMGVMWTEMHKPIGSNIRFPRSRFISCDDILKDMDAEYDEDVQWIARQRTLPVNIVEDMFQDLRPGDIKGNLQSFHSQGNMYGSRREVSARKRVGRTHDTLTFWEIYSKNGFGDMLHRDNKDKLIRSEFDFSGFGKYCYIVVANNIPYPLNMPSWTIAESVSDPKALFDRVQWPIPFHTDSESGGNGWPYAELRFYDKPRSVWPVALAKACIPELRFVNWCMSFLADKVAASATTYIGVLKAAGAEIQSQLEGGLAPFTRIEIADVFGKSINDVVSIIQPPAFQIDIWTMLTAMMDQIDKRLGLSPLMYGEQRVADRSATVSDIKQQNLQIRPDDMAEKTETWYSESAMKEMQAACWMLGPEDMLPVVGEDGAKAWEQYLKTTEFDTVVRDYNYRVEAGSARKPNKKEKLDSLQQFTQAAMPMIQEVASQGNFGPWNALMHDVAKTLELDATPYLIPPPEPQEGPSPEEMQAQAQMQMDKQKHEMEMAKLQLEADIKKMELELHQREHQMDLQGQQAELGMKGQEAQNKLMLSQREAVWGLAKDRKIHDQEVSQDAEVHRQDMQQDREKHSQEMDLMRAKSRLQAAAARSNGNGSSK